MKVFYIVNYCTGPKEGNITQHVYSISLWSVNLFLLMKLNDLVSLCVILVFGKVSRKMSTEDY